jgi:transposase
MSVDGLHSWFPVCRPPRPVETEAHSFPIDRLLNPLYTDPPAKNGVSRRERVPPASVGNQPFATKIVPSSPQLATHALGASDRFSQYCGREYLKAVPRIAPVCCFAPRTHSAMVFQSGSSVVGNWWPPWVRLLAYVTGSVSQELLLRNECLAAENCILRAKLPSRLRLSNPERATLAEIGKRPGRKALREVARVAKPDTILVWYRRLIAQKFDGSQYRQHPGRPRVRPELEFLVVRMARENIGWGYDRIVGALANLGHRLSDETVRNILRRHGIAPAPKRSQRPRGMGSAETGLLSSGVSRRRSGWW